MTSFNSFLADLSFQGTSKVIFFSENFCKLYEDVNNKLPKASFCRHRKLPANLKKNIVFVEIIATDGLIAVAIGTAPVTEL